ncbi:MULTISPECIES: hypothetical protein [unclassified Spirosoma]|uniref:hypothetical protein n=1 Tax=unclassified Spirosoma TaxID=2621999 RepID=UPI000961C2CB|nr:MULTISPECIES: hypothetical protein [unclassified Spirosoma]MBN8824918.1 hypothetical protein [Spirosoma sp.]OJW74762.1 MAG: hypothetical protein BGO59_28405 [Spirosoma sp. 48-14]
MADPFISMPIRLGLLTGLLGVVMSGCTKIYHSRRSIQELDQTFSVNKQQALFYTAQNGHNQSESRSKARAPGFATTLSGFASITPGWVSPLV